MHNGATTPKFDDVELLETGYYIHRQTNRLPDRMSPRHKHSISVLILDGESTFAPSVIRCLAQIPRVQTHLATPRRWTPARFCRTVRSCSRRADWSDPHLLDSIHQAIDRACPDVVLAVDEDAIRLLCQSSSEIAERAAVAPVPLLGSFSIAGDKWKLASFLRQHELPHPATVLISSCEQLESELGQLRFPVLIKPTRGGNGVGIQRFSCPGDLLDHVHGHPELAERFVAQEEMRGFEIDCSLLQLRGRTIAYTIQKATGKAPGKYRPAGHIRFLHHDDCLHTAEQMLHLLEWSGVAHVDLMYDEDAQAIRILEINPRFWGSLLGSLRAGVNFPYLACLAALGVATAAPSYSEIEFAMPSVALRLWRSRRPSTLQPSGNMFHSALPFLLRDPIPELVEQLSTFWEILFYL
jgi:predicted ATP-grasp superfamily ATP-dependent carboligase